MSSLASCSLTVSSNLVIVFIYDRTNLRYIGLHLTGDGYRIVYEEVLKTIRANWPDQDPALLPMVFPGYVEAPR